MYAHIPRDLRGKFNAKFRTGIFIGYTEVSHMILFTRKDFMREI